MRETTKTQKQNPLSDSGFQVSFMVWLGTKVVSEALNKKMPSKPVNLLSAFTIGKFGNLTQICFHGILMVRESRFALASCFYCILM